MITNMKNKAIIPNAAEHTVYDLPLEPWVQEAAEQNAKVFDELCENNAQLDEEDK